MNTNPVDRSNMTARLWEVAEVVACDIENVNRGGCGVFAVILCEELHRQGFTDAKIRAYNYDYLDEADQPNLCEVEKNCDDPSNMHEWREYGASFVHIVVEFDGRLWDCNGSVAVENGKRWNKSFVLNDGHVSLDAMRKMADKKEGWNFYFDRNQIPTMKKIVKMMLAP